jgi:hypothetical protein
VFVSQSVNGVIYVARVPQWKPFLWGASMEAVPVVRDRGRVDQNDRRVDVEG